MNVKMSRTVRLLSFLLAATVALTPAALAADSMNQNTTAGLSMNQSSAPVVVSKSIVDTSLGMGTATADGVNVRENPTEDDNVVATLSEGENVIVLSRDGDWYRVCRNGMYGFVHFSYMTVEAQGSGDLGYGLVSADIANVRQYGVAESESLLELKKDDAVRIYAISDGWYEVAVDDVFGFVRSDLIDPTVEVPAEKIFDYVVVSSAGVNLRAEPNSDSSKNDMLYDGSLCTLWQQEGEWYLVQYGENYGYVHSDYVTTTNDASAGSTEIETENEKIAREAAEAEAARKAAEEEARRQAAEENKNNDYTPSYEPDYEPDYDSDSSSDIVSVAKQYLGVPYVWGGTTPSGFDCSGFVQYVFRKCGYSISRTATPQYSDGTPVSYSNLRAGDLVFFERTYNDVGITHVGIYIGGGDFIHAGGGCVKISSLSSSYYSSRYYGACRIA